MGSYFFGINEEIYLEMAIHELIIPKTGLNMEDCYLLSWLSEEGEKIEEGAPVFQMEIEKAAMDIESDVAGWLHHLLSPSEDIAWPIGTVVGLIADSEEEYRSLLQAK